MEILEIKNTKLNPNQEEAIKTIEGPVLVIAGPGTGKTQVLSLRIANILKQTDASASNILCLTFTESGVTAMRERLMKYIGTDAYYVKIHTFHSFCNEIILTNPTKFSFSKELKQLDDLSKVKLMRGIIDEIPSDIKNSLKPIHESYAYQNQILSAIQTLKREGISPELLLEKSLLKIKELEDNPKINKRKGKPTSDWQTSYQQQVKNLELQKVYQNYQFKITNEGFYDYEDMILFVTQKLTEDSELLAELQEKYLYILVDEYQDTNGSQNNLLKLVTSFDESPNIFAVGDDDQAIYRFQGANVENLLSFSSTFKNLKKISLIDNYRSSQTILDISSSLIQHNELRLSNLLPDISKKLKAGLDIPDSKTEVYEFSSSEFETRFITEKIQELNSNGIPYRDIAVFYRSHADSEDLINSLIKSKIPFKLAAGNNALNERIIQQLINLLKSIAYLDEDRDFILFKILFYDFLKFSRLDVFRVTNFAAFKKLSLFQVLSSSVKLKEAGVVNFQEFITFTENLAKWRADSENLAIINFVEILMSESGFLNYVFFEDKNIENINSLNSFYNYFKSIYQANNQSNLISFLIDLNLLLDNNIAINESTLETERNGVQLMTAHKSKGLEFPYVFIIHLYDSNWEKKKDHTFFKLPIGELGLGDKVERIEDERRLLYVAMTRAKKKIFLSFSKEYTKNNNIKKTSPSQFIYEMDKSLVEFKDSKQYEVENPEYFLKRLSSTHTLDYSLSEEEYLRAIVKNFKLTASAFLTYLECPLKFKYDYLIKIPRPTNKVAEMGSGIHLVLEKLSRSLLDNQSYSVNELIDVYSTFLNKNIFNRSDVDQLFNEGSILIKNYIERYKNEFLMPAEVEYIFHQSETIMQIPGDEPIVLRGKLDKLEWIDKPTNSVRIVDYKVTVPVSQNEIKGGTKKADPRMYYQLVFYEILAECDKYFRPKGSLTNYKILELQIDFVKPNQSNIFKRESFPVIREDVQMVKDKIIDVVKNVRALKFFGSDEYPLCRECEYCKEVFTD